MLVNRNRKEERTGFQESSPYDPAYDLQTDFVMVYGIDDSMPRRIKKWTEQDYVIHLMTGVSWGQYQDYLNGEFDGRKHWDEAQTNREGETINHGKTVPYMVPTISFAEYLTERIKRAVDAGVKGIHMEEPEFWVNAGYSTAFKREWEIFYDEPWQPPHESEDAQYRASKLKAYLYTRCLRFICDKLKEYAKVKYNRILKFYVPTHSLVNYTQWKIISPESKLLELPNFDGYISQVWTGTSRTANVYEGERKERTFENAFLEYGVMKEMVRFTDHKLWFLHDPIEDNPRYTWENYKKNYLDTVIASLLHPENSRFEICPWPKRVFTGKYPTPDGEGKEPIPDDYATVLLTLMHTLGNMNQEELDWHGNKSELGVLMSDSSLYQRYDVKKGEAKSLDLSSFYGIVLPLLKDGNLVNPVPLDNVNRFSNYLDKYEVLILSYEFMKPSNPGIHNALAQWVQEGGVLIYVGDDSDPYHQVREWWNQGDKTFVSPAQHLFETLGVAEENNKGMTSVGQGVFGYIQEAPANFTKSKEKADLLRKNVQEIVAGKKDTEFTYSQKNNFLLHRGPYVVARVMEESVSKNELQLDGLFVDLFSPELEVIEQINLKPGEKGLYYDLEKLTGEQVQLIAASSRVEDLQVESDGFSFKARGPKGVNAVARFYCEQEPTLAEAVDQDCQIEQEWDTASSTLQVKYPNQPQGLKINISY